MDMIKVSNLKMIDTTKYKEGTFFFTDRQVAYLHNGKMEPLLKRNEIKKMIQDELKKEKKNEK